MVQSQGKLKELAESLEMPSPSDLELVVNPNAGHELLKIWSDEMKEHSSDLRTHLSYHLITLGYDVEAKRCMSMSLKLSKH